MRRWPSSKLTRSAVAALVVIAFWILFPPFRIVQLNDGGENSSAGRRLTKAFDPASFVDDFWRETLEPAMDSATPLVELVGAVARDPAAAENRFGRQAGEGAIIYYFSGGEGKVVEIKARRAIIEVAGEKVSLLIAGPVFGNAVRDGAGLLSVNKLPGLDEYNAIAAALNARIENEVLPPLKEIVQVGARISFVACAKAPNSVGDGPMLEFIPMRVEVVP